MPVVQIIILFNIFYALQTYKEYGQVMPSCKALAV